jgi:hypothetical protein
MIFNIFLMVIILFIVFNMFFDFKKIYNTGNFDIVEGLVVKEEVRENSPGRVIITYEKDLSSNTVSNVPTTAFSVKYRNEDGTDGSNVSIGNIGHNNNELYVFLNGFLENNTKVVYRYTPPVPASGDVDLRLRDSSNVLLGEYSRIISVPTTGNGGGESSGNASSSTNFWAADYAKNFMNLFKSNFEFDKRLDECTNVCSKCEVTGYKSVHCNSCRSCWSRITGATAPSGEFVSVADSVTVLNGMTKYGPFRDYNENANDFNCKKGCVLPDNVGGNCRESAVKDGAYWKKCKKICVADPDRPDFTVDEDERAKWCYTNADCNDCIAERHFPCNVSTHAGKITSFDCDSGVDESRQKPWKNRAFKRRMRWMRNKGMDTSRMFTRGGRGGERRNLANQLLNADIGDEYLTSAGLYGLGDSNATDNAHSESGNRTNDSPSNNETSGDYTTYNQGADVNRYSGSGASTNYLPSDPNSKPAAYNSIWDLFN